MSVKDDLLFAAMKAHTEKNKGDYTGKQYRAEQEEHKARLPGSGGGAQPDWNQNDETAADYVKNRTHYSEPSEIVVLEETTLTFDENGEAPFDLTVPFEVGKVYTVDWNSTKYNCTATLFYDGAVALGNLGVVGVGDDTGEPFVIVAAPQQAAALSTEGLATVSLGITTIGETVHKLAAKYLPVNGGKVVYKLEYDDMNAGYYWWDKPGWATSSAPEYSDVLRMITEWANGTAEIILKMNPRDFFTEETGTVCPVIAVEKYASGCGFYYVHASFGQGSNPGLNRADFLK